MKSWLGLIRVMAAMIAVLGGMAKLCLAQIAGIDTNGNKLELVTVYEKAFEKTVVDAILSEAVMTVKEAKALGWKNLEGRKDGEKVKLPYPKVVFIADPDEINFRKEEQVIIGIDIYYKNAVIKKQLRFDPRKGKRAFVSKGGKYLLVSPAYWEEVNLGGGSLYKDDGTLIWEKNGGPIPVSVSDKGDVVGIYLGADNEGEGPAYVTFYDLSGRETGRIENPYKGDMGGCSIEYIDEDYVLVVFRGRRSAVILATNRGEIIWQREYDEMIFKYKEFDVQKGVGIIGLCDKEEITKDTSGKYNYQYIYYSCFIDWLGNVKWKEQEKFKGDIKAILNSNNAFMISSSGYLWCRDLQTGKLLWRHKGDWSYEIIDRVEDAPEYEELKKNGRYIYVIGKYIDWRLKRTDSKMWYSSALFIFDAESGSMMKRIEYPNKRISLLSYGDNIFLFDMDVNKLMAVRPTEAKQ